MSDDFDRVQGRFKNISTVKPILGALRTISMGNWQAALKRQARVRGFESHYRLMLNDLLKDLPAGLLTGREYKVLRDQRKTAAAGTGRKIVLVIGSERGLCGAFNATLVRYFKNKVADGNVDLHNSDIWVLGSRLYPMFTREQIPLAWGRALPSTVLPQYPLAHELVMNWLRAYEESRIEEVLVIYNRYHGPGLHRPTLTHLIPPVLNLKVHDQDSDEMSWKRPIIETNPIGIYIKVLIQLTTMSLFQCLLESAASEHAARYSLMEEATQNADRLIDEMTEILQMYRRQAITQEMLELAAGAGLLD